MERIHLKTPAEIEVMAEGGKILSQVMRRLREMVKPGITTKELDKAAEDLILKAGGIPAFKGYKGSQKAKPYPATLCTSLNEEIVHALPSERVLKEGDILSLDLGLIWKGFYLDMALTLPVGKVSFEAARLIRVTKKALKYGIKKAKLGNTFGDIGNTIQRYVESQGFQVIRDLCGHGIGRQLHEEPQILNYGKRKSGPFLREGMVFCIEPMVAVGTWEIERGKDGFSYVTKDGSLSAHFEATLTVTKQGPRVLTPFLS